jgi:hypothetical protein
MLVVIRTPDEITPRQYGPLRGRDVHCSPSTSWTAAESTDHTSVDADFDRPLLVSHRECPGFHQRLKCVDDLVIVSHVCVPEPCHSWVWMPGVELQVDGAEDPASVLKTALLIPASEGDDVLVV